MSTTTPPSATDLKAELLRIAEEMYRRGPGFAQESVVLRKAAERLGIADEDRGEDEPYVPRTAELLGRQQELLAAWHRLFHDGDLVWGYDLDSPGPPCFHLGRTRGA
jgi:hypothetical protein